MSTETLTYDVFLSYSLADASVAELVERALQEGGLDVFNSTSMESGAKLQDRLWRALAESSAIIAIVHPQGPVASSIAVEVGAAKAWRKPVYVVHTERGDVRLPDYLAEYPTYPIARIDDIVRSITRGLKGLSEDEQQILCSVYSEIGIPTDQLMVQPASLDKLAREFNNRSPTRFSGEQLVRELLQLRKRGMLQPLRKR
ncbi:MAG: toll/interleukin-1 receptor domain-containing protein [Candidatus Nealsonbacteria bacterium]|nr:toll/interleukin-1 receptor domain-containing protein [Candidatus Nealsonbacteria bacterium]